MSSLMIYEPLDYRQWLWTTHKRLDDKMRGIKPVHKTSEKTRAQLKNPSSERAVGIDPARSLDAKKLSLSTAAATVRVAAMTVSPKPRRGLRCLAALAGCALLALERASWKQARPSDQGQMVCGEGVSLCGVLTLATGLGAGAYKHPTPSVHGLWPEVAPYGTSACVKPSLSTSDPRRVVQCYDATGTSDAQIIGFETHEWEKHGECAGVADARAFLTTVCSLAEQPLQAMSAARTAGGDLDAARRAVVGLGIEVFSVDEKNSQLILSACSDGQTWTLAPVADFPAACGGQRAAAGHRPLFVIIALVLVFCALVRAGMGEPTSAKEEPAGLTKQKLARLEEGGDEASKPPSSSLGSSWVEQEAPSTPSSAESWAEVEAGKPHEFAELDALNEEEKLTYIHTFVEKNRRERLAREMRPKMQPRGVPAVFTLVPAAPERKRPPPMAAHSQPLADAEISRIRNEMITLTLAATGGVDAFAAQFQASKAAIAQALRDKENARR